MGENASTWDRRTVFYVLGFALLFLVVASPFTFLLPHGNAFDGVALAAGGFVGWRLAQRKGRGIEAGEGETRLRGRLFALLAVLVIHAFGALTWAISLGFSSDAGTEHQLDVALGIGAVTWLVATLFIVWFWRSRRSPLFWFIPLMWWLPSFLLAIEVAY